MAAAGFSTEEVDALVEVIVDRMRPTLVEAVSSTLAEKQQLNARGTAAATAEQPAGTGADDAAPSARTAAPADSTNDTRVLFAGRVSHRRKSTAMWLTGSGILRGAGGAAGGAPSRGKVHAGGGRAAGRRRTGSSTGRRRWSLHSQALATSKALASTAFDEVSKESLAALLGAQNDAATISLESFPPLRRAMVFLGYVCPAGAGPLLRYAWPAAVVLSTNILMLLTGVLIYRTRNREADAVALARANGTALAHAAAPWNEGLEPIPAKPHVLVASMALAFGHLLMLATCRCSGDDGDAEAFIDRLLRFMQSRVPSARHRVARKLRGWMRASVVVCGAAVLIFGARIVRQLQGKVFVDALAGKGAEDEAANLVWAAVSAAAVCLFAGPVATFTPIVVLFVTAVVNIMYDNLAPVEILQNTFSDRTHCQIHKFSFPH